MALTLFLPFTTHKIFLMILVFFAGLALVSKKLLELLLTRYISKESVSRLILLEILFFYKFVSLKMISINLADTKRWL